VTFQWVRVLAVGVRGHESGSSLIISPSLHLLTSEMKSLLGLAESNVITQDMWRLECVE